MFHTILKHCAKINIFSYLNGNFTTKKTLMMKYNKKKAILM